METLLDCMGSGEYESYLQWIIIGNVICI